MPGRQWYQSRLSILGKPKIYYRLARDTYKTIYHIVIVQLCSSASRHDMRACARRP